MIYKEYFENGKLKLRKVPSDVYDTEKPRFHRNDVLKAFFEDGSVHIELEMFENGKSKDPDVLYSRETTYDKNGLKTKETINRKNGTFINKYYYKNSNQIHR